MSKDFTIPANLSSIGTEAFYRANLYDIIIPNGVSEILENTFKQSTLNSIHIAENVTSIQANAFHQCRNLSSITLPSTLKSIKNSAFEGCLNLKEIHCNAKTPPTIYPNVFKDVQNHSCEIYVPKDYAAIYKNTDGWNIFDNVIEF